MRYINLHFTYLLSYLFCFTQQNPQQIEASGVWS